MADRHDPRGMVDTLAGKLPPGTTVDDSGQLIYMDTGEPVKSNPNKLMRLMEILGMAVPMSRVPAAAAQIPAVDAGMNVANRVAPQIGKTNDIRSAIAGPPPANVAAAAQLAGPSDRAVSTAASSQPAVDLSQMQPRIASPQTNPLIPRSVPPRNAPVANPAPSDVLPPPRTIGGESAAEGAGQPWVTGSRTNMPVAEATPVVRGLSKVAPGANAAQQARAMALEVLGQRMGPDGNPQPMTSSQRAMSPLPEDMSGQGFARQLPSDYQPTRQQSQPAPAPQQRSVPLPPRRPADLTPERRSEAPPDWQSNGRQVVDNNRLNWGSGDSAADFVRASKALQNDPSLIGMAHGGAVHPEVLHALAIIRKHLGVA